MERPDEGGRGFGGGCGGPSKARHLSRREVLGLGALAALGAVYGGMKAGPGIIRGAKRLADSRENVVLIVADAMRADAIGKVINGVEVTPYLNRLAEENTYFTNAYSSFPFTKPSVASIFTGVYPPGHGVEKGVYSLPETPTLAGFLKNKGYITRGIVTNPWVSGEQFNGQPTSSFGFSRGFDDYQLLDPGPAFEKSMGGLELAFASGVDVYVKVRDSDMRTGEFPVFMYLHYMDTHQPWVLKHPTEGITGVFHSGSKGKSIEEIHKEDVELIEKLTQGGASQATPEERRRVAEIYYEACKYLDSQTRLALETFKRETAGRGNIVIFTADHGDELYEHRCLGHGANLFNPSTKVPFIIAGEEYKNRGTSEKRLSNVAIFPTVMKLFGEKHPAETAYSIEDVLASKNGREAFMTNGPLDAIVLPDGRKCIVDRRTEKSLLFDTERDPGEQDALAEDASLVEKVKRTRSYSEAYRKERKADPLVSSHSWQNPLASLQIERAMAEVRTGKIRQEDAARMAAKGGFLTAEEFETLGAATGVNSAGATDEKRRQLQALGYLN